MTVESIYRLTEKTHVIIRLKKGYMLYYGMVDGIPYELMERVVNAMHVTENRLIIVVE